MSSADEALIDELVRLERAGDLVGALRLLRSHALSPQDLMTIGVALYRHELSWLPFAIARQLLDAGFENWLLYALSAHLGLRIGQSDAADASADRLEKLLAQADAAEREKARAFLDFCLTRDIVAVFHRGEREKLCAYARLWTIVDPATMQRFALPGPQGRSDPARFLEPAGDERLFHFEAPPADVKRIARKAVLAARRYWYVGRPVSREQDIPVRIAAAMTEYGWPTIRCDLRSFGHRATVTKDYEAIAAQCRRIDADLLVIDEFQPRRLGNTAPGEIVRALKRDLPGLRVVGLYLDPWEPEQFDDIEAGAEIVDAVWSPVVTALWQRPAFRGKTLFFPMPHGGSYTPAVQRRPGLEFHGGVQSSNWDRAFWLEAIAQAGIPLQTTVSTHANDHLDALESYRAYLRKLGGAEASVNFARRGNGIHIHTLTARTFEVPAAGGLLVQERSDDIDRFLVAGRHYLRFEALADLADIAALIRAAPDRIDAVRREGAAFFRARYADDRIVAYLDNALFHPARSDGGTSRARIRSKPAFA